jgi:crotonobetainyl-CoA:carnitine CoA-transferase CaiB-like acyl-CoA transferase
MFLLDGIRVVELCEVAAGPFASMLLADMGADVVKVERDGGDAMRSWPPITGGDSENFASVNRGKRSVMLDLKSDEGRRAVVALIEACDVLIENYRPGVMDSLGLGYEAMSARNPGLVYCSISAFGQSGPRSTEGGFDLTMQAMAGVMSVTGEPGGAPVKCGVPLCDFVSGLYGALGVVSALHDRHRSGRGRHIDVAMMGATLAVGALQTSEYFGTGLDPRKRGSAHPRNAPYQAFRAADGYFGMAAGNDRLWHQVCAVVERLDLEDDARFTSPSERAQNQEVLRDLLEEVFSTQPVEHWLTAFAQAGVPCSPINTYSQALADPQVEHMGWVQDLALPNGAMTRTFGPPVRIDGATIPVRSSPPGLGQHTDEVLAELGLHPDSPQT